MSMLNTNRRLLFFTLLYRGITIKQRDSSYTDVLLSTDIVQHRVIFRGFSARRRGGRRDRTHQAPS